MHNRFYYTIFLEKMEWKTGEYFINSMRINMRLFTVSFSGQNPGNYYPHDKHMRMGRKVYKKVYKNKSLSGGIQFFDNKVHLMLQFFVAFQFRRYLVGSMHYGSMVFLSQKLSYVYIRV